MFTVTKRLEVSASHQLKLDYPSKCQNLHGHNWIITVHARSEELDHNGMVIDFTIIKEKIHGRLDHRHIIDVAISILLLKTWQNGLLMSWALNVSR